MLQIYTGLLFNWDMKCWHNDLPLYGGKTFNTIFGEKFN